jgi:hypothetical protein
VPNFNEAFTELNLGQLIALAKCVTGDRRDGGIDKDADHIASDSPFSSSRVDEDFVISIVRIGS